MEKLSGLAPKHEARAGNLTGRAGHAASTVATGHPVSHITPLQTALSPPWEQRNQVLLLGLSHDKPGMEAHTCDPSTGGRGRGTAGSSRPA